MKKLIKKITKKVKKPIVPKVRAPKGYFFRIIKSKLSRYQHHIAEVKLYSTHTKTCIGYISLMRHNIKWAVTHSTLNQEYHGLGLGALLYSRSIQWGLENGWRVRSSSYPSEHARRVWRGSKIRKLFKIKHKASPGKYGDRTWYASCKSK